MHQSSPEKNVCVRIAKDNILEATISILVDETLVNNILQFGFQFVIRNWV